MMKIFKRKQKASKVIEITHIGQEFEYQGVKVMLTMVSFNGREYELQFNSTERYRND